MGKSLMKNTFISGLFILMLSAKCSCQNNRIPPQSTIAEGDTTFNIGNYLINPSKKLISVGREFGEGEVGTMFGYFPDESINFDKTSLIILGKDVLWKEYLPPGVDFNSLKYIGKKDNQIIFKDNNYIYWDIPFSNTAKNSSPDKKIPISGFVCINNYIYEDKFGALYFLNTYTNNGKLELTKIVNLPNLDKSTLKHLQGQYYADKNGLYALGVHYFGAQGDYKNFSQQLKFIQLEYANGKRIKPIITRNYLVYNKSVYAQNYSVEKLKIDTDKMVEFPWSYAQNIYFITDGSNLYENRNSSYYEKDWNKNNDYANDFFKSGVNILKIFPHEVAFAQNSDLNTLYFKNAVRGKTGFSDKNGILIKTDEGYYYANGGRPHVKPQKIDNIIIYNYALKKNEPFDDSQFLGITAKMYAYKGLVFFDDIPLKEINGPHHFKLLISNGIKTNFLINDDMLIAIGNIGGYQSEMINGSQKIVFEKMMKRGIDASKLKVINENLLVDDNNFYSCNRGELSVIPIKKLGLDIKVLVEEQIN